MSAEREQENATIACVKKLNKNWLWLENHKSSVRYE